MTKFNTFPDTLAVGASTAQLPSQREVDSTCSSVTALCHILPNTLNSVSTAFLDEGISSECVCFLRACLARWRVSGVDRILYLCLARITSITSCSRPPIPALPEPPSYPTSLITAPHCSPLRGPAARSGATPTSQLPSSTSPFRPGQRLHLTLPAADRQSTCRQRPLGRFARKPEKPSYILSSGRK